MKRSQSSLTNPDSDPPTKKPRTLLEQVQSNDPSSLAATMLTDHILPSTTSIQLSEEHIAEAIELDKYLKANGLYSYYLESRAANMRFLLGENYDPFMVHTHEFCHKSNQLSRSHYSGRFWCPHHQRMEAIGPKRGYTLDYSTIDRVYSDNNSWLTAHRKECPEVARSVFHALPANEHRRQDVAERAHEILLKYGRVRPSQRKDPTSTMQDLILANDVPFVREKSAEELKKMAQEYEGKLSVVPLGKKGKASSCKHKLVDFLESNLITNEAYRKIASDCADCRICNMTWRGPRETKNGTQKSQIEHRCVLCVSSRNYEYTQKNLEKLKKKWKAYKQQHRVASSLRTLAQYWSRRVQALRKICNDSDPHCQMCNLDQSWVLDIDHLESGKQHRKEIGEDAVDIINWVLATDAVEVRSTVQTLCKQCHVAKTRKNGWGME